MGSPGTSRAAVTGRTALIGYTGFVGGNLLRQEAFDDLYNSSNVEELSGRSYDLVVCAAAPAEKWRANQDPESDRATLRRLMDPLGEADIDELILISTVDVYDPPFEVDESTVIDREGGHPYGRHRLGLEDFCTERFRTRVVRLPGLFGRGLKKNVVYDMLNRRRFEAISPGARYQFYSLHRLWADLQQMRRLDLDLVNFATPPISVAEIATEVFGIDPADLGADFQASYDMRTRYGPVFGGVDGYVQSRSDMMADLGDFVASEGWKP
jgi:nucleoside-diphosphate-sugar epimerase